MPDMIEPVGAMIKPPDPMQGINTLSGIIGLQQRRQALQTGAIQQQTARAESQMAQLEAQKQQGVQDFFKSFDPSQHLSDDGTTDLDSALQSDEFKNSGNAKPAVMQMLLNIKNQQLSNKTALAGLNNSLVTQLGSQAGALADDPDVIADKPDKTGANPGRAKVREMFRNFSQLSPDAARVAQIYGPMVDHTPPNKLSAAIGALQMQARDVGGQQEAQFPRAGTINTGGRILPTVTPPKTGVPQFTGQQIPTELAPQLATNPNTGGQGIVGGGQGTVPAPIGGAAGTGGGGGLNPWQPVQGQPEILKSIEETRKADADYGVNRHINQQIIRLSKDTATGPGTEVWHHALGAVAGPLGGDNVADYQTIGAYLDRQAALSARQMGLPDTNAGLATAASLSGTTGYQPGALQTKVKLTDALVEGAHQYRSGLDKVVGTGPNQDLRRFNQYRSAWSQNFDPMVYLYKNADKAERAQIVSKLSPAQAQELLTKARNLDQLSAGKLP